MIMTQDSFKRAFSFVRVCYNKHMCCDFNDTLPHHLKGQENHVIMSAAIKAYQDRASAKFKTHTKTVDRCRIAELFSKPTIEPSDYALLTIPKRLG